MLSSRWRLPILLAWAAATLLVIVLIAAGDVTMMGQIEAMCSGAATPQCANLDVDPAMAEALRALGLSLEAFAWLAIALDALPPLVALVTGGVLVWRRGDDRMAVFAAFTLILFVGTVLQSGVAALAVQPAWQLPVHIAQCAGSAMLLGFLCVFPDGRFVPRWSRLVTAVWIVWCAVGYFTPADWPVNQSNSGSWFVMGVVPFAAATIAAQMVRYFRFSSQAQRQQTKWVLVGFALSLTCILSNILLLPRFMPAPPDPAAAAYLILAGVVFMLALLLMPISVALAVLRYRLFDVDLLISRTLVYAGLSAGIVSLYVIIVGYLGALFQTGTSLPISLVATGAVALAFQPLRERLQRGVNRLVYGERDDPYALLSRLAERLGNSMLPERVLPGVVQTIAETLKLPYVAIELVDQEHVPAVSYGDATSTVECFPLMYGNTPTGVLKVAPRTGSSGFGAADRRLLADIARQAGAAAHAVRLSADLQHSRERLVAAREEERRRLRRDLHDGLGPALAAQALKIGSARVLYARDPASADRLLQQLENDTEATLEEVRRLAYNLRPPSLDQLGFVEAIRDLASRYESRLRMSLQLTIDGDTLPAGVEVAVYRILDEALTNVIRHANADRCDICLCLEDGALRLEIADNGLGLTMPARAGVGLTSMRERAEELGGCFATGPNVPRGTRIAVTLPLPTEAA